MMFIYRMEIEFFSLSIPKCVSQVLIRLNEYINNIVISPIFLRMKFSRENETFARNFQGIGQFQML